MTRQRKAELLLILATAFWGISYYLTDVCFAELEPLTLNAIRFILAFLVLGAVMFPRLRRASRTTWKYSVILGLVLTV
ncbi:MAG: EamA family transporter, partial [Oscillospiraceae bacterium]|nr:EamA family transporter [Oscillospiraceae bacterium]